MDGIIVCTAARNPICFKLPREVLVKGSSVTISTPIRQGFLNACLCLCVCVRVCVCVLDMESDWMSAAVVSEAISGASSD